MASQLPQCLHSRYVAPKKVLGPRQPTSEAGGAAMSKRKRAEPAQEKAEEPKVEQENGCVRTAATPGTATARGSDQACVPPRAAGCS